MRWRSCRSGRTGRATCCAQHVTRHDRVERQGRRCMSHCTRTRGDLFARACRPARSRRATCKGHHVVPRADPERHARMGMSLCTRGKCDMDRVAVSLDRSCKATCTGLLVVRRARAGRHALAPWATTTRENVALGFVGARALPAHAPQFQCEWKRRARHPPLSAARRSSASAHTKRAFPTTRHKSERRERGCSPLREPTSILQAWAAIVRSQRATQRKTAEP
jgi:hypothetical protein